MGSGRLVFDNEEHLRWREKAKVRRVPREETTNVSGPQTKRALRSSTYEKSTSALGKDSRIPAVLSRLD